MSNVYDRYAIRPQGNQPAKQQVQAKVYKIKDVLYQDHEYNLVDGCWGIYQDGSQTLAEFLTELKEKMDAIPDILRLYIEARIEGWPHAALLPILETGLAAVYDTEMIEEYMTLFRENEENLDAQVKEVQQTILDQIEARKHPQEEPVPDTLEATT